MEAKVAVIGETDFVLPFSALGLDAFAVPDDPGRVVEASRKIAEGGYGLVIVAEDKIGAAGEVFSAFADRPLPCVVVSPFTGPSTGESTRTLARLLRLAAGIDIFDAGNDGADAGDSQDG
jgi:vacuolar-type H+-ATPase subunit F/Vma7